MSVPLDLVYANNKSCFSSRRQITVLFLWACLCSAPTQKDVDEKTTAKAQNTEETQVGGSNSSRHITHKKGGTAKCHKYQSSSYNYILIIASLVETGSGQVYSDSGELSRYTEKK